MVAKKTFTPEELGQIIDLFNHGHFIKEIALQFNTWEGCIKRELQVAGLKTSRKLELTDEQIERLLNLYKDKSLDELETLIGCKRSVITRILRDNGALIRRRGKIQKYFTLNGEKTCSQCHFPKPITEFSLHSNTYDGLQPTCKECNNRRGKNQRLQRKFGITEADYNTMLDAQAGVCAICGQPETRTKFGKPTLLAVDHNHKTGAVRQLICSRCNMAIGLIDESPTKCDSIKAYLIRHNGLSE